MTWDEAKQELLANGTPAVALGYCKIAFDMGEKSGEEKESRRWSERMNFLHTEYGADCSGTDSGDVLDCVEVEIRQVIDRAGEWLPGIPESPDPDRLYAVMSQPKGGYAVGCVIRGEDCNWESIGIIAHYPLPLSMNKAEVRSLIRRGRFEM